MDLENYLGKCTEHAVLRRACRVACRVAEPAVCPRRVAPCGAVWRRVAPCSAVCHIGDSVWCRVAPEIPIPSDDVRGAKPPSFNISP
eukprot:gene10544-biopygen3213